MNVDQLVGSNELRPGARRAGSGILQESSPRGSAWRNHASRKRARILPFAAFTLCRLYSVRVPMKGPLQYLEISFSLCAL